MILLEITDETGVTHYEIIGLSPETLADLDDKTATGKVRRAIKKARKQYNKAAQKGDKEAEEKLARLNRVEVDLKDPEKRKEYDEELESGKGTSLEVLRIQRIAPPFFWDRNVRFQVIERLMREAGMTKPIPVGFDA
jgi:curved DNA-binding protein CbpA